MLATRRQFISQMIAGSAAVAFVPALGAQAVPFAAKDAPITPVPLGRSPVVGILLDQPYLDLTGLSTPYVPPRGLRSGQALAELGDQAVRTALYWR
jgi:hypothetical protein